MRSEIDKARSRDINEFRYINRQDQDGNRFKDGIETVFKKYLPDEYYRYTNEDDPIHHKRNELIGKAWKRYERDKMKNLNEQYFKLQHAVEDFLDDLAERHPGEEFTCPYVRKLAEIIEYNNITVKNDFK